ncbi:DUF883 domain-containing protein [Alteromonas sp. ASW11-19]|uniref:DUF883 domain-containing protein n=1 Tax=Alteromonas salexigens TaxID=2982530 RepID=A0ABT2VRU9_9ALTE|nr:DUF883 domain-containing protein [Alteromonas salexigens]MCU7555855.1 DUF883 domain-containing protein [Alteromonas salexigens]
MATQSTSVPKTPKVKANSVTDSTHPMTDKLQETLHSSVDKLAGTASVAEENLRDTASASAENMAARQRLAKQKWQASSIRKYAVENPVAAAGIAFAAGMFLTSILRKR